MLLKQCWDLRLALDVAEGMCIAPLRLLSALHRPSAPESTTRTSVRRPSCSTAHNPCRSGVPGAGEPMRYVALCGAN